MTTTAAHTNIDVTNNKICRDDDSEVIPLVPALKRLRTEARSTNPSCIK